MMRHYGIIGISTLISVSSAFCWGIGTHAYFNSRLGKQRALQDYHAIYGALIRDVFIEDSLFLRDPETHFLFASYLWGAPGNENFMHLWDGARSRFEKNLAYGIVVNNNLWGLDITACKGGLTYGQDVGWSVQTVSDLVPVFAAAGIWQKLLLDPALPEQVKICRKFTRWVVDYTGDILMAKKDKTLGMSIVKSALIRSPKGINLLVRVIGREYENYIKSCERKWRTKMMLYGAVLMLPEENAVSFTAYLLSQRFKGWLRLAQAPVPPDLQMATEDAIIAAMGHVEESFLTEIQANLDQFPALLEAEGLTY